MEFLVGRLNHFAVSPFHRALHCSRKVGDSACVVALTEEDLVGIVDEMVVGEGLEELDRFQIMVVASHGRRRTTWPVNSDGFCVPFSESVPKRTVWTRVPSIVESLHQIQVSFNSL